MLWHLAASAARRERRKQPMNSGGCGLGWAGWLVPAGMTLPS